MHFSSFFSILFRNTSSSSKSSSSSPMQTSSSPAGFKNITEVSSSPSSNLNHPSMINRFNFRSTSSSSSSSSCSTSHSSPISLSPCSSSSSLMCGTSFNDHDESHHHNDQEEVVDEGELRYDREISIRDQRSGIRRNFPPPIPLLARTENLPCHMPWVLKRSYTEGRLVIKEVKVKHHEYFRALRSNGRLVLKIMHMDENQLNLPKSENPIKDQDVVDDENQGNNDGVDVVDHHEQDEMKQDIDNGVNDDDDEKNEKKHGGDYVNDDDDTLSLSSDEEEEEQFTAEEIRKVCVSSSSSSDHHHGQHGLLRSSTSSSSSSSSSQLPSSSSFQPNPILEEEEEDEEEEEEEEEKQDFHEVLRKKVRESMILASSMPEGSRVIGSCQPNNYKKSNLFRMPIASVRAVHS